MGIPVGIMLSEYLTESIKEHSEDLFKKLGEESGLSLAELSPKVFKLLKGNKDSKADYAPDYSLVRLLAKAWQIRLEKLADSKNFEDSEFKAQTKLIKKWSNKFAEAASEENNHIIYELFPKESFSDSAIQEKAFETITNLKDAENNLWETLKPILNKWINKDEIEIFEKFENDVQKALVRDLQDEILVHLKDNPTFRESFHMTFEFFVVEQFKALGKSKEIVEKELKGLKILSENILNSIVPKIDYSSKTLKQAVLDYLTKIADKATEPNKIYPEECKTKEKKSIFFNNITQRVQVVKKEQFDIYKAKLDEKARIDGTFREEIDKKVYDQRGFEAEMFQRETQERIEIYEWNDETRKDFKRNVILGDPGLGKSSLLNFEASKIAVEAIEILQNANDTPEETSKVLRNIKVPINLRIADIASEAAKNKELALTIAELASFDEKVNDERKSLELYLKETICKQQNAVLLFDALDEVPEETEKGLTRKEIAEKISNFAAEYQENSILLTSRKVNYESVNLHNAKQNSLSDDSLEILPFDETQIKNYVAGWFGKESQTTESFLNLLENQSQTAGLSQNPLMLFLMCRVFYDKQREHTIKEAEKHFPNSRCEIYEQCLHGLLKDWKDGKIKKTIKPANLQSEIRKLERTAFNLFFKGYEQFSETDFQTAFCDIENINLISDQADENSRKFLEECKTDGIITETTIGKNPQYRFIHLTFQEYLTASYLAKQPDWKDFIFEKHRKGLQNKILFNPDWQHTLQLLSGKLSAEEVKEYIETLLQLNGENGEGDMFFRPYQLAIFIAEEASNLLSEEYKISLLKNHINQFFQNRRLFDFPKQNLGRNIENYFLLSLNDKEANHHKGWQISSFLRNAEIKVFYTNETISRFIEFVSNADDSRLFELDILEEIKNCRRYNLDNVIKFIGILKESNENTPIFSRISEVIKNTNNLDEETIKLLVDSIENENSNSTLQEIISETIKNQENLNQSTINWFIELLTKENGNQQLQQIIGTCLCRQKNLDQHIISSFIELIKDNETSALLRQTIAEIISNDKKLNEKNISELFSLFKIEKENVYLRWRYAAAILHQDNLSEEIIIWFVNTLRDQKEHPYLQQSIANLLSRQNNLSSSIITWLLDLLKNERVNMDFVRYLARIIESKKILSFEMISHLLEILKDKKKLSIVDESVALATVNYPYLSVKQLTYLITLMEENKNKRFAGIIAFILPYQKNLTSELVINLIRILESPTEFSLYSFHQRLLDSIQSLEISQNEVIKLIELFKTTKFCNFNDPLRLFEVINKSINLPSEIILWLVTFIKNNENIEYNAEIAKIIGNQNFLSKEIYFELFELLRNDEIEIEVRRNILKSMSINTSEIEEATILISLIRNYLVKTKPADTSIFDNALFYLASKFQCAVPLEGEIILAKNEN